MRLMNVHTFELEEFFGVDLPHYAILSHRWEEEEVTFQDLMSGRGRDMIGWRKVEGCCDVATVDELEWVWIDSCCIDKTSSAELSEAINSMFRWYRDAEFCYAYLSDVPGSLEKAENMHAFRFSKWFTRGWTLQELLAPDVLSFYDRDWKRIGTKHGLRDKISAVTGINHLFNSEDASVAQKMSWAAKRETTRLEDQAYCLLGIFGVNMPPLYGEGRNAFLRLQLEIMRISNDESLFTWEDDSIISGGLLAPSPLSFKYAFDIKSFYWPELARPPYSMTNKGLEISVILTKRARKYPSEKPCNQPWVAPLNCVREGNEDSPVSVVLKEEGSGLENYQRIECNTLPSFEWPQSESSHDAWKNSAKIIYVKQPQIYSDTRSYCYFQIDSTALYSSGWEIEDRNVSNSELGRWRSDFEGCLQVKLSNSAATVKFRHKHRGNAFYLQLSCVGKKAKTSLFMSKFRDWDGFKSTDWNGLPGLVTVEMLNGLPSLDPFERLTFQSTEVSAAGTKTLTGLLPSGKTLKVSLWKGGSKDRELFVVGLDIL